jgi:hypothetical protein
LDKTVGHSAVLIDDLAVCYHAKPRMTRGICFWFKDLADIPDTVAGSRGYGPPVLTTIIGSSDHEARQRMR